MKKRGIGIGTMLYAIGFGFNRPDIASALVEIAEDGTATVITGCAELGQGSNTVLCQIVAEELGIRYEDVRIVHADTAATPDAGPTTASRQTYVSGNAVKLATADAKKEILNLAAEMLETSADILVVKDRTIYVKEKPALSLPFAKAANEAHRRGRRFIGFGWYNNTTKDVDPETGLGDAYATYLYATHFAEVEVDTETGEVTVLNFATAHDVGKAINPLNIEGQVEGSVAMGLGYALQEEIMLEHGQILTPSLSEYYIPTALDMPDDITTFIVEEEEPTGPFGAKGLGEAGAIPTAPAIINAIYDAVGVRVTKLPATAEHIRSLLRHKEAQGHVAGEAR